eukprot:m.1028357 g.1028357  ORF g.1028357 m.1028357 type:complete len:599 (-) comp24110_c0_seq59:232-2028(-)
MLQLPHAHGVTNGCHITTTGLVEATDYDRSRFLAFVNVLLAVDETQDTRGGNSRRLNQYAVAKAKWTTRLDANTSLIAYPRLWVQNWKAISGTPDTRTATIGFECNKCVAASHSAIVRTDTGRDNASEIPHRACGQSESWGTVTWIAIGHGAGEVIGVVHSVPNAVVGYMFTNCKHQLQPSATYAYVLHGSNTYEIVLRLRECLQSQSLAEDTDYTILQGNAAQTYVLHERITVPLVETLSNCHLRPQPTTSVAWEGRLSSTRRRQISDECCWTTPTQSKRSSCGRESYESPNAACTWGPCAPTRKRYKTADDTDACSRMPNWSSPSDSGRSSLSEVDSTDQCSDESSSDCSHAAASGVDKTMAGTRRAEPASAQSHRTAPRHVSPVLVATALADMHHAPSPKMHKTPKSEREVRRGRENKRKRRRDADLKQIKSHHLAFVGIRSIGAQATRQYVQDERARKLYGRLLHQPETTQERIAKGVSTFLAIEQQFPGVGEPRILAVAYSDGVLHWGYTLATSGHQRKTATLSVVHRVCASTQECVVHALCSQLHEQYTAITVQGRVLEYIFRQARYKSVFYTSSNGPPDVHSDIGLKESVA